MRALLISLCAVFLATCADAPAVDEAPPAPAPLASAPVPTPFFLIDNQAPAGAPPLPRPDLDDPMARQAYLEAMRDRMVRERGWIDAIVSAPGWREADAIARATAGSDSLVAYKAAVAMLQHQLLKGAPDADKAEAIGRYAQALLCHRSGEGALMLRALRRLDGVWEDGRRQSAARAAANRLGFAYVALAGCLDCTIDEALAGMWPEKRRASEGRLRDIATAHRELMRIAHEGTPMP
ncbi:hypothetical protein [Rubrivirga sp. IMCC43871]|uniref:hypothetical protein n=1 Tax=Rubrivirga sp. IMCC43871 TaxID=3391575 RepID=UPI00398F999A